MTGGPVDPAKRLGSSPVGLEIMMPFYGSFDHFRQAVESVLAQSDPVWHLTILDDVYPDEAPGHWVVGLGDDRITYIRNDENLRPSRNYNKAIGLAASEYMVIMGCDDVMLPDYIARVKALIQRFPGVAVIQPGVEVIDENSKPSRPLPDRVKSLYRFRGGGCYSGERLAVSLLRGNWTYFPSLVWRTDLLKASAFRPDLDVVQDLAKLFELTVNGGTLALDDLPVFAYRRHSRSVSAVTGPDGSKFVQEAMFFAEAAETCEALGWRRAARVARIHASSRLNALTELPGAILARNRVGVRNLTRHILGRPPKHAAGGG